MIKSKKFTGVYRKDLTNDKSYYITYKHNSKKIWLKIGLHSEGVREAYCSKKRAEITSKLRLGELPDMLKDKNSKTFDEFQQIFFKDKTYPLSTKKDYQNRYTKYIKSYIGKKTLSTIVQSDIQEIHNNAMMHISPKTASLIIALIRSIFIYAIELKECKDNPAKRVKLPKIDNTRDRFLDKREIELLLEETKKDKDLHLFCAIALTTGGRVTAVCLLARKDISLSNKIIFLRDAKNNETYKSFLSTKVELLLDIDSLSPNDSIFKKEKRIIQRRLQTILNRLFNKGLDVSDRKNRVVVHTLRHTFASHLAINGTPIFTIQKLMNHKDIAHTIRYAKLAPDSGRDMIEGII